MLPWVPYPRTAAPWEYLPRGTDASPETSTSPLSIYLGLRKEAQPTPWTFTLFSRSGIPFKITKIASLVLPVTVESEPLKGKEGYRVEVQLNPKTMTQPSPDGTLLIETTHPTVNKLEIEVAASIRSK